MTVADLALVIAPLSRRDIGAVRAIDRQVYPRPWSAGLYRDELRQPETRIYLGGFVEGRLVGYAGVMLVADEGHVTSIAVDPVVHGRGVATRLMAAVTREAIARSATAMTLEVRVGNRRAQDLYRRFGFAPAGIRASYYPDNGEDALVMWCHDLSSPENLERLADIESTLSAEGHGEGS